MAFFKKIFTNDNMTSQDEKMPLKSKVNINSYCSVRKLTDEEIKNKLKNKLCKYNSKMELIKIFGKPDSVSDYSTACFPINEQEIAFMSTNDKYLFTERLFWKKQNMVYYLNYDRVFNHFNIE